MSAHLLSTLVALAICCTEETAGDWRPVEQPDLAHQLAQAPTLEPEALAAPARGVTSRTFQLVPNPDGKTYDAPQWYFKSYSGLTRLYACDPATEEVNKQRFPDRRQMHMHGGLLAPDGECCIVTPDWSAGMNLFVYDPATNRLEGRGILVPNLVGETRRLVLGPDGLIYGTGNDRAPNKAGPLVEVAQKRLLGIGFLWTMQSQEVAGKLTSKKDFVDLILGPGKLDVFQKVKPPVRVACIARSLERNSARPFPGVRETIEMLRKAGVPPKRVIIAYNPERQPGTPTQEMDALVASARRAAEMARAYGAPLLIGPGLREMQKRKDLYAELAKHCDIWMIQSQRLQLDPVTRKPVRPAAYRASVKSIVDRLRQGNPKIRIFVQLVTTAERGGSVISAAEIAAFARSVEDLVDAVRIYGGSKELLDETIARLRGAASSGLPVMEPSEQDPGEPSDELRRAQGDKRP